MGQQSEPEFVADMRFVLLLFCLLHPIVNGQSDPLTVISAILDTVGIEYVPPPARPGTCRECSRSQLARFGIDLTPTLPTNPCCTTTTAAAGTTFERLDLSRNGVSPEADQCLRSPVV